MSLKKQQNITKYLNHGAYNLPISARNRERIPLYNDYKSKKDAIDRAQNMKC